VRILLVAATDVRTSDAPFLLARALEQRGAAVRLVPIDADLPFLVAVGLARAGFGDGVYRAGFQRHLLGQARAWSAEAVLVYGSNWALDPSTIRRLREQHGCQVALWEVNQRLWRGHQAASVPLYDHVFALDSHFVPVFAASGVRCVEHLCACADADEHRPVELTRREREWYEADVSFVGTQHPDRVKMLSQLTEWDLRIYGVGWEGVEEALKRCVRTEPVYGLKKAKVYSASRVSINVHGPHVVAGENFRVFEVAACGGVSFSTFKPDLASCFVPGTEVVVFDDADDLTEKLRHYLGRPDELHAIAEAGRRRVLAEHTYADRAAVILRHLRGGC
jgi:spore maturation protein CgeB